MLEAYDRVFKEYTIEEVESSYLDIETYNSILDEEEDKDINPRTEKQLEQQAKNNGIHSYLGFIIDCINTLEKNNINTSSIKERLQQLQNQNIFKDIDKYQLYQNIIQKLVVSRIGDNNSSYLTYTLNFDIKKLMDSINLDNEEYIYNELNRRLENIEQLLKENNLSTIEYFKSLRYIQDIDIIYKNVDEITPEEIRTFLENVKIGKDSKINIFIKMLTDKQYTSYENGKPNEYNIFSSLNQIPFEGYESINGLNTAYFWSRNSSNILEKLSYLEENAQTDEERKKYQTARRAIVEYKFTANLEDRIDCYIEMLTDKKYTSYENGKPNEYNIFSSRNKIPIEGYERINGLNTANFWSSNSQKIIIPLLFFNKQYDSDNKVYVDSEKDYSSNEYDTARNAVLEYLKVKDIHEYIDKLEKKNAKVLELINLRNNLRKTLELLRRQESKLIQENNQLHNEYLKMQDVIETRRAV